MSNRDPITAKQVGFLTDLIDKALALGTLSPEAAEAWRIFAEQGELTRGLAYCLIEHLKYLKIRQEIEEAQYGT